MRRRGGGQRRRKRWEDAAIATEVVVKLCNACEQVHPQVPLRALTYFSVLIYKLLCLFSCGYGWRCSRQLRERSEGPRT